MSPELHRRVRKLFDEALDRPDEERLAFLKAKCADDGEAYQAVVRLLEARDATQSFLEDRPHGLDRIGRYVVTGELGRGAMGVVYEAVDPLIGRNVAVKVIHLDSLASPKEAEFMRDRLFREARSAGHLFHPGIVIIFDVGQEGDLAFFAMERVNGLSLQQVLVTGRRFGVAEVQDILRQTSEALDFAHRNKIVHRDVKPGNIILDQGGAVKLTDFGIAKFASTEYHTRTGLVMGTPSYMSPEQIEGRTVEGSADQFSLAVVAYELLTGTLPFRAESLASLAYMIVHSPAPSARAANPALPEAVDAVLLRGLAKSPGARYAHCSEFVAALEAALAVTPPAIETHKTGNRTKVFGVALAIVLAIAAVAAGVRWIAPKQEPPVAVVERKQPPPLAVPAVFDFSGDPLSGKASSSATLHWSVSGATNVTIAPDVGTVEASGTAKVKPQTTTVYTLTATGPGGQVTRQVQVTVNSSPGAAEIYAQAVMERRAGRLNTAIGLFRQAADLGEIRAMLELGNISAEGELGSKNDAEAMRWFRMAADHGSSTGMLLLGGMYYMGNGVPVDFAGAAYWFRKASDGADPAAKYDLGAMYEEGLGVPKDMDKAKQLFQDAARLGNDEAKRRLVQLSGGR